ncbi:MAG: flagellar motor protein MotB [Proteobacteria bacterium]|nr:flagellar motor protein MotB [Pseudomonadota bacterium]
MASSGQSPQDNRPLIIVKRYRRAEGAHHGGAWKIAYADFVTAMMAFFLVMWLVASVSKQERAAIFQYFKNPSMQQGKSVQPAPGMDGPGGASTSPINLGGGLDAPRTSLMGTPTQLGAGPHSAAAAPSSGAPEKPAPSTGNQPSPTHAGQPISPRAEEHKRLEALLSQLREAVAKSQALKPFKDQLLIDIMPQGLRIQIIDAQNRPMFDVGSVKLKSYTVAILRKLAPYLASVPNSISITGHTDATPYIGSPGYTNWELSADRANAARRILVASGLPEGKIARIVGLADSAPMDRAHPFSPVNRRISIIVMTREAANTPEGLVHSSH